MLVVSVAYSAAVLHLSCVSIGLALFDAEAHLYGGPADPRRLDSVAAFAEASYREYSWIISQEPIWFLVLVGAAAVSCNALSVVATSRVVARLTTGTGLRACSGWIGGAVAGVFVLHIVLFLALDARRPGIVIGLHNFPLASSLFWFWSVMLSVSVLPSLLICLTVASFLKSCVRRLQTSWS